MYHNKLAANTPSITSIPPVVTKSKPGSGFPALGIVVGIGVAEVVVVVVVVGFGVGVGVEVEQVQFSAPVHEDFRQRRLLGSHIKPSVHPLSDAWTLGLHSLLQVSTLHVQSSRSAQAGFLHRRLLGSQVYPSAQPVSATLGLHAILHRSGSGVGDGLGVGEGEGEADGHTQSSSATHEGFTHFLVPLTSWQDNPLLQPASAVQVLPQDDDDKVNEVTQAAPLTAADVGDGDTSAASGLLLGTLGATGTVANCRNRTTVIIIITTRKIIVPVANSNVLVLGCFIVIVLSPNHYMLSHPTDTHGKQPYSHQSS